MKLTKNQIDYAVNRVTEKVRAKAKAETGAPPKEPAPLSDEEKYDMISKGVAKLRVKRDAVGPYTRLLDSYDYPVRKGDCVYQEAMKKYEEKRKKANAKWEVVGQQALDKIYLCGDAAGALAIINSI